MTTTLNDTPTVTTGAEPVFLWGPGYTLTARQIINALGSYLATFGDNFHPGGVNPFDAIHAEVVFTGDLTDWTHRRTPEQIAVIRARAQQIASEFFDGHFPNVTW